MKQRKCKPYETFEEDVKALYGRRVRIYGPYIRNSDNRRIVVLKHRGKLVTKLYAKVKLEIKLDRILSSEETVDHKDGNHRNDKFSNLQLLSLAENARKDATKVRIFEIECAWCGTAFKPSILQRSGRNDKDAVKVYQAAGPFCSKSCTGKYTRHVQLGGTRFKRNKVKYEYYK